MASFFWPGSVQVYGLEQFHSPVFFFFLFLKEIILYIFIFTHIHFCCTCGWVMQMPLQEERAELTELTVLLLCSHFCVLLLCSSLFRIAFFLKEKVFLSCLKAKENKGFKVCEKRYEPFALVQRIPLRLYYLKKGLLYYLTAHLST